MKSRPSKPHDSKDSILITGCQTSAKAAMQTCLETNQICIVQRILKAGKTRNLKHDLLAQNDTKLLVCSAFILLKSNPAANKTQFLFIMTMQVVSKTDLPP